MCMKIAERMAAWRRERRVLLRVSRAAWRLEQAERERSWALASARAEGVSIRALAAAVRLSSSRVHQIVAAADLDEPDAQLGELRAAGWPAPEDPDSDDDAELDGRDSIADRLSDEVSWLRQCADWLAHLDADSYPPAVNLRPSADWPGRAVVAVDLARVRAVIDRIATDVDELARARRVQDLDTAVVLPDRRAERRRRLAEPDLEFRAFCTRRRLSASPAPHSGGRGTTASGQESVSANQVRAILTLTVGASAGGSGARRGRGLVCICVCRLMPHRPGPARWRDRLCPRVRGRVRAAPGRVSGNVLQPRPILPMSSCS